MYKLYLLVLIVVMVDGIYSATVQQASQSPLTAYVLTDQKGQAVDNSGVRIGLIDMAFETPQSLQSKYQLPQELVSKLAPFAGLTGQRAIQTLKSRPLVLSQAEYNLMNSKVKSYAEKRLNQAPRFVQNIPEVIKFVSINVT